MSREQRRYLIGRKDLGLEADEHDCSGGPASSAFTSNADWRTSLRRSRPFLGEEYVRGASVTQSLAGHERGEWGGRPTGMRHTRHSTHLRHSQWLVPSHL
jgi:hypothetical protein